MSISTSLASLALAVAIGAGAVLYGQNQDLKERVAGLEQTAALAPGDDAAPGTLGAPALQGARTQREVAELRRLTSALVQRVDANEARVQEVAAGTPALDADPKQAAKTLQSPAFAEAVREVVLQMAEEDVAFRAKVGTGERTKLPKNAPFAQLADVLELDASQEAQMSKDLQAMQQDLFGILSMERDDGVVPLELIVEAEDLAQNDPRRAELFMKLFTLNVPGEAEETYMQRAVKLTAAFRKQTAGYLRPQQLEIWNALEVDLFSIKFD